MSLLSAWTASKLSVRWNEDTGGWSGVVIHQIQPPVYRYLLYHVFLNLYPSLHR